MPQKKALAEYYLLTGDKRSIEIAKNIAEWGKKWGKWSRPKFRSAAKEKK